MFAESKYNEASQKLRTLQQNEYEIGRKHDELQRKQMAAESEKNELSEMMQRKNREVDRLQRSEDRVSFYCSIFRRYWKKLKKCSWLAFSIFKIFWLEA